MKQPNVALREPDDDLVSEFSMSFFDEIACNDAAALKQALVFLKGIHKGAMKAKEQELTRLRDERDAAIESKFSVMMEMSGLKNVVGEKAKMIVQAQKGKEEAMEEVKVCNEEIVTLKGSMKAKDEELARVREEKDAAIESKIEIIVEMRGLNNKFGEQATMLSQAKKEREEAIEQVKNCKSTIDRLEVIVETNEEELARLREEKGAAIELNLNIMTEMNGLKNKADRELAKMIVQAQKEKEEAIEQVKVGKEEIVTLKGALKANEEEVKRLAKKGHNMNTGTSMQMWRIPDPLTTGSISHGDYSGTSGK